VKRNTPGGLSFSSLVDGILSRLEAISIPVQPFRPPARRNWLRLLFSHLFDFVTYRLQSYSFFAPSFSGLGDYAFSGSYVLIPLHLFHLTSTVICCIVIIIIVSIYFDLFHFHRATIHVSSVHCSSAERSSSARPTLPFTMAFPPHARTRVDHLLSPSSFWGFFFLQLISAPLTRSSLYVRSPT